MSDFAFQVFLNGHPSVVTQGETLLSKMTPGELAEFDKNEVALVNWGTDHFPFDYSKESALPEWLAWYNTVNKGTRLMLYAAASEQGDRTDLKSSVGADVIPRWVWYPTFDSYRPGWRTTILPMRQLRDSIYARIKFGVAPTPTPTPTPAVDQNTPHSLDTLVAPTPVTTPANNLGEGSLTPVGLTKVDPSTVSGQIVIGVIVALIAGYLLSRS